MNTVSQVFVLNILLSFASSKNRLIHLVRKANQDKSNVSLEVASRNHQFISEYSPYFRHSWWYFWCLNAVIMATHNDGQSEPASYRCDSKHQCNSSSSVLRSCWFVGDLLNAVVDVSTLRTCWVLRPDWKFAIAEWQVGLLAIQSLMLTYRQFVIAGIEVSCFRLPRVRYAISTGLRALARKSEVMCKTEHQQEFKMTMILSTN